MHSKVPTASVLINVTIIVTGVIISCFGEMEFNLFGFFFQMGGVVAEITRLLLIQQLISGKGTKMDPLCSLYYFAPVCAGFNIIAFLLIELPKISMQNFLDIGIFHLLANAFCALALNISVVFLVITSNSDYVDCKYIFAHFDAMRSA
jgi:ABC-type siderophore export system fused ATPase/permease subunit